MKRLVIAVMALLAVSSPAAAQRQSGPPQSNTGLFKGITLAPAQQKQVDSLWNANLPMREKVRAQMESGQQPDSAQMANFRALREKSIASYRQILTPDQQKVFDKNIADMQSRMGSMGGAPRKQ
jgi:Spy/CpxP family protein refolding chaperone